MRYFSWLVIFSRFFKWNVAHLYDVLLFCGKYPDKKPHKKEEKNEQGTEIEKNLYADPDFAKTYEADKNYAAENGEAFIEMRNREVVALIAYLQRLGTDIKIKSEPEVTAAKTE